MPASKQPKINKVCKKCKNVFLSNNIRKVFCSQTCCCLYNRSLHADEHRAYAAKLMRQRSPERKKTDAIRKRGLRLFREYGISESDYLRMKSEQSGKCLLCNETAKLVVDHDHSTGYVRGLLCHHCNRGLGFFSDNSNILLKASEYVRKSGEKCT